MYVDKPVWRLKKVCPCCGMGLLELVSCPYCNKVYAMCDEVLTLFLDPLNISFDYLSKSQEERGSQFMTQDRKCDNCGVMMKLRYSTDDEIIALGLTTEDYE